MKKNSFIIYFITIFTLCACDFSLENSYNELFDTNYYKFTAEDQEFLLSRYKEKGRITEFINQHNETVRFENSEYFINKESNGSLLSSVNRYKYDKLWIQITLVDKGRSCATLRIQVSKRDDNSLIEHISIPSDTGISCLAAGFQFTLPDALEIPKTNLNINGKTYTDVLIFEVSDAIIKQYTLYKDAQIHKVYYDLKEGVIGFDDTINNLQYRIKE